MSFAADTALTPAGEHRWTAVVDDRWRVARGPFGGFVAALLTRALGEVTAWPPRTLAVHFVDAPAPGEVAVTATLERRGRSSDAVGLRLDQDGRTMALALATAGAWRDDQPAWDEVPRPPAPPRDDCERIESPPVPFLGELDVRMVDVTGGEARNVAWLATATHEPLDDPLLAALSDVWMPPAFLRLGAMAAVPTLDLTTHWRAPLPAGVSWVLAEHRSAHAAGGTWTCDGTLWAPDGTVLAQCRQLALLRTAR